MRRSSSRAGITTLTPGRRGRGGERRAAAAAAREPGDDDGARGRLGEGEQHARGRLRRSDPLASA